MVKIHVIIPAAGSGSRMNQDIPKQFTLLEGRTILEWIDFSFSNVNAINTITIVLNEDKDYIERLNCKFSSKTKVIYSGGKTRAETVLNTLIQLKDEVLDEDWVLVHDSARLGLSERIINAFILDISQDKVGGIMAIPATDTIKRVNQSGQIVSTENREELWLAQTPQMFRYKLLVKALKNFGGIPTDESQAVEALGLKPKIVEGSIFNFKITYPEDLLRANESFEHIYKGKS